MKNIKFYLFISILILSTSLYSNTIEDGKHFYDKFKKYEDKYTSTKKIYENKFGSINQKQKQIGNASAKWSLVNSNCEFDPKIQYQDALDRFTEQLGDNIKNIAKKLPQLLMNNGYDESCELIATGLCIGQQKYMEKMNMQKVQSDIQQCIIDKNLLNKSNNSGGNYGSITLGCGIPQGQGVAPSAPVFPFCANPTNIYIPCGAHIPVCTPFTIPNSAAENGNGLDPQTINDYKMCNQKSYADNSYDALSKCEKEQKEKCLKVTSGQLKDSLDTSMIDLKMQQKKCILDEKFVTEESEKYLNKKSVGKLLPNNMVIANEEGDPNPEHVNDENTKKIKVIKNTRPIKNGKIDYSSSGKGEEKNLDADQDYAFELNKNNLKYMNKVIQNSCYSAGEALISNDIDFPEEDGKKEKYFNILKEECENFHKKLDTNDVTVDDYVYNKLIEIDHNFYKFPVFYRLKYSIFSSYIKERNEFINNKFLKYRNFDEGFFLQHKDIFKDLFKKINLDLKDYDSVYNTYIKKFDVLTNNIEYKISMIVQNKLKNNKNFSVIAK